MKIKNYIAVIGFLLLLMTTHGCSTFQTKRVLDMAPFSETMTSLVGDIQFGIQGKNWIYLKPYLKTQRVSKIREELQKIGGLLRGIVFYSLQVVALNSAPIQEAKKSQALGMYLDGALRPSLANERERGKYDINISLDTLDRIIKEIKTQENFIDGLGKAQPLIDAVIGYSDGSFNDLKSDIAIATNEISTSIDSSFAATLKNISNIETLKTKSVQCYWLLYRYRFGEEAALDSLLRIDPALSNIINSNRIISNEKFIELEQQITQRMDNIDKIKKQLDPEFELYKAHKRELDEIAVWVNDIMRKARIAMVIFARSHRNLAAGVTIPPEIDIMGEAGKAFGKIIP